MHFHLLDANSVPAAVEIFSSFVAYADNNTFHLVGIKEEMIEQWHFDSSGEVASSVVTQSSLGRVLFETMAKLERIESKSARL